MSNGIFVDGAPTRLTIFEASSHRRREFEGNDKRTCPEVKFVNSISELTQLPTITLVSVVLVLLIGVIFHATYNEKTVELGPTILTTTGIFFTFLGIAIGLKEFDVSNIQASVPALLGGLKTAFWASVGGVGAALTLKGRRLCIRVAS